MAVIDSIAVEHYRLPLEPPFHASWDPVPRREFVNSVVRVRAGSLEGVGAGEAMHGLAGNEHLFIGQQPGNMQRHVQLLDNLQFFYGRMWPLEVALWDLWGQQLGQPLWRMLGGSSARVPLYASTGERQPAAQRAASARLLKARGFPALKLRFHAADPRADLAIVQAVRTAIGPDMHILVDANQGWQMAWDHTPTQWDFQTACWMADALAELDVYWLEEPLHRHDYRGLAALRQRSRVRIAGGEANRDFHEQREYLRHGSLDVYQADVVWSTGITRARQLAAEVAAAGALYSPHTWGDALVLLANLHVSAAVSNAPFIEYPCDPPTWTAERRDFLLPAPLLDDGTGHLTLPDAPGLGVTLDWQALEHYKLR